MKTKQFCLEAIAHGCYVKRHGSNHDIWYSPITGKTFAIPRHGSQKLPKGLERKAREVLGF
ncbi:MAG: type II toxin-antitoxin system HicA family toxin [Bacteroidaceae bacterium]|nr:type II toxin-antitoxin system HicA family toxin [Bacteroidaceae bacterium]